MERRRQRLDPRILCHPPLLRTLPILAHVLTSSFILVQRRIATQTAGIEYTQRPRPPQVAGFAGGLGEAGPYVYRYTRGRGLPARRALLARAQSAHDSPETQEPSAQAGPSVFPSPTLVRLVGVCGRVEGP